MEPNSAVNAAIHTPSHTSDKDGNAIEGETFRLGTDGTAVTVYQKCIYYPGELKSISTSELGAAVNIIATSVESVSSNGNVLVSGSVVSRIKALGKVTLYGRSVVQQIKTNSEEGCLVKGSTVQGEITAKMGPVTVIDSYVSYINAFGPVAIEYGGAGAVTIRVDNQRNGVNLAKLELNKAKVADVRVKLKRPKPSTPQNSSFSSDGAVSRNSSVENKFRTGEEIEENGQTLRFNSTESWRYYDLVLGGKNMQYPLLPPNIEFLQKHYKEPIDISPGGVITDTHGKFVHVQGTNINPMCALYITGNGEINGPVVFKNCEGTVFCEGTIVRG